MTNSPHSEFNAAASFFKLDERIQRWIWEKEWPSLYDVQARAIEPILAGDIDVIIAAPTAFGKTEAAFFPVLTKILQTKRSGIRTIYLSPLKALINDQFERLEFLCEHLEVPVHRWHGDVAGSKKQQVLKSPTGVLLMTPESLEALFINHGTKISRLFEGLEYIVVDEAHAFIGTERGRQLQSLMHRLERQINRSVQRIALSATLSDLTIAAEFLRPGKVREVCPVESKDTSFQIKAQVRGYLQREPASKSDIPPDVSDEIAKHLFDNLRGSHNMIFANSRSKVEDYADRLRSLSEREHVQDEFTVHHGSLSSEIRADVESRLRDRERPCTVVCTSTLEMGIDVGAMKSVAQMATPPSVSALRQRVGRSGRRMGESAILRMYSVEAEVTVKTHIRDQLRASTVQQAAMLDLMLRRWCEPSEDRSYHFSTLIQQVLSVIAERGGIKVTKLYDLLCGTGPFRLTTVEIFKQFLKQLGERKLIEMTAEGDLLLAEVGEKLVNHYSFYTAFSTPDEYRLVEGSRTLGSLPFDNPILVDTYIIFAGRRWKVLDVDDEKKVIQLVRAKGGTLPKFTGGSGFRVHREIRQRMFQLFQDTEVPRFLDARAKQFLEEGRHTFRRLELSAIDLHDAGDGTTLFLWDSDMVAATICAELAYHGVRATGDGLNLDVSSFRPDEMKSILRHIAKVGIHNPHALSVKVENKKIDKHDHFLSDELLIESTAARSFDVDGATRTINEIASRVAV